MAAALFVAAVAGGGVAVAIASLAGVGEHTTTVREIAVPGFQPGPDDVTSTSISGGSLLGIYTNDAPGVVQVTSTRTIDLHPRTRGIGSSFLPGAQVKRSLGSGFVIDKAGYIVTSDNVVADAQPIFVSFSNNDAMKARLIGRDPSTNIALLKVEASSRALKPLELGNSDDVQVGDQVAAIGNPLGYDRSISAGIVSALQHAPMPSESSPIDRLIQTDTRLANGNSGGPLLNARGQVVGVSLGGHWGGDTLSGNSGTTLAVPINTVRDVVAQLKAHGRVDHPLFGVIGRSVTKTIANQFQLPVQMGILVERVIPGSGAEQAGLLGGASQVVVEGETYQLGGDLIVKAGGQEVNTTERLREIVSQHEPGDTLSVEFYRGSENRTADVKLGRPPPPPQ